MALAAVILAAVVLAVVVLMALVAVVTFILIPFVIVGGGFFLLCRFDVRTTNSTNCQNGSGG